MVNGIFEHYTKQILVSASGMAGLGSPNEIVSKKLNKRFYLSGDGTNGIEDGLALFAPHVAVCANHQANMILRIIAGYEVDSNERCI